MTCCHTRRFLWSSCCLTVLVDSGISFWALAASNLCTALENKTKSIPKLLKYTVIDIWLHFICILFTLLDVTVKYYPSSVYLGSEYLANQRRASFRDEGPSWYHVCWYCTKHAQIIIFIWHSNLLYSIITWQSKCSYLFLRAFCLFILFLRFLQGIRTKYWKNVPQSVENKQPENSGNKYFYIILYIKKYIKTTKTGFSDMPVSTKI